KLQFGECYQSSTSSGGACERAFDGRINQHYAAGSCTHTKAEKGFWQAYIRGSGFARVRFVLIYNRLDCCSDRLNSFSIFLDGQECESYSSRKSFSVKIFRCNKVGQMLVIKNRIKTPLTLCEVQIFGNYIPRNPYGGVCSRAIDNNDHQFYSHNSCSHTKNEKGWWQARTKSLSHIRTVRITNRIDCCSDRLNNFVIMVDGTSARRTSPTVSSQFAHSNATGSVKLPPCSRVMLSNFYSNNGVCQRAFDGNTSPNWHLQSCTHTKSEFGWWQATLKERSLVKQVRIYNRLDCCSERLNDFSITVDGQECASFKSSGFFSVKTFQCNKVGQKLRINNRKRSPLTLCEVQVFGEKKKSAIKAGHFVGCFFESNHWPDFDSLASSSDDMTREKCNCLCLKRGTSVFALREGNQCRCGDNYGSNGEAERSDCRLPCAGDSDQMWAAVGWSMPCLKSIKTIADSF
uniref:WSC domain-containing protein n=1 Tax=Macrostomum lignano TaxID=282301 RepID=A0A1I8FL15_9PLAT